MPISDLCSRTPTTIDCKETLQEAASKMKNSNVGTLVVTEGEERDKPIGIITDRDIVMNALAEGKSADTSTVEEAMTTDLITADSDIGIYEAINLMEQNGVRRLVLMDEFDRLCGLISTDDLVSLLSQEMTGIGKLYENQIQRSDSATSEARSW